jgi:hypothetical protein
MSKILKHGNTYREPKPERPDSHVGERGVCRSCRCEFILDKDDRASWQKLTGFRGEVWGWVVDCPECKKPVQIPKVPGPFEREATAEWWATPTRDR